jgi:ankyrin repeat protein
VRSGWLEGAEMLLKGGADPNVRDSFDNSPLHIALPEEGRLGGVALLLKYGADPSLKDRNGNTPLHVAMQVGYPLDMIKALLAAQAPVNAQNAAGDTPLHIALRAKRFDYAKALLDGGADIFLVNGRSESPCRWRSPRARTPSTRC